MKINVDTLESELTLELNRVEKLSIPLTVEDLGFTMIALIQELAKQLDVDVEKIRDLLVSFVESTPIE